jgi:DNA repair protein RadD
MILRGYQRESIDSLYTWFAQNTGNPLVVLPTAAGKSVIQATFVHEAIKIYPSTRILLVSHVKELLEQNAHKLLAVWPEAPIGVYSAGLGRRDTGYQITIGGIQSIYDRSLELGMFDLVMVDECHLIPPSGDGMYRRFMADQHRINELVKIIGMTATPYRMKTGRLDEGDDALFDGIAYEVSVRRLIDEGFLSNLISKKGVTKFDIAGVGTRGGEFIPGQLEAAMDKAELTRAAVDEMCKLGTDRQSWIIFCAGVEHAYNVRDEIRSRGISAATVSGETPDVERATTLAQFKEGPDPRDHELRRAHDRLRRAEH